jgi:tRNA G18 (ribose-2'-O)-methylase SpoU
MASRSLQSPQRHPLTLCASLVQNPMNLGALCRTAEVWRLQSLVLSSADVLAIAIFGRWPSRLTSGNPSAFAPAIACPTGSRSNSRQGSTVIALTRHPQAIALADFAFPTQAALLLGRELTGIPAELMQQCDAVVEIPQWGQVESLNVATAGAIATYEYLRQQATPQQRD